MNLDAAFDYLDFVGARHRVWELRQAGAEGPWSDDPLLQQRKFTNVFRVLDHGSQFLLGELLNEPGITAEDALMRSYLYRITNRPDVWAHTKEAFGRYPLVEDLDEDLVELWRGFRDDGQQVFSGAYVIRAEPATKGVDKVYSVVNMARRLFHPDSPQNIAPAFLSEDRMGLKFEILVNQPGIGDFIAMQTLTDFGYSPFGAGQDEDRFVIAGPGAKNGAKAIFPDMHPRLVIQWAHEQVSALSDCPLLEGRKPSLMDIQNTLCEFSKYVRYQGKPNVPVYSPAHPGPQPPPVLPEHWGLI